MMLPFLSMVFILGWVMVSSASTAPRPAMLDCPARMKTHVFFLSCANMELMQHKNSIEKIYFMLID
jgi:hypothetical protein